MQLGNPSPVPGTAGLDVGTRPGQQATAELERERSKSHISSPSNLRLISGIPSEQALERPIRTLDLTTIELLCSPFRSFREIGRFHEVVAALPGVKSVQPRRVQDGAFQIRVECGSSRDLLTALAGAYDRPFSIAHHEMHRIEIALESGETANPDLERRGA